jgi:hypothetical protein
MRNMLAQMISRGLSCSCSGRKMNLLYGSKCEGFHQHGGKHYKLHTAFGKTTNSDKNSMDSRVSLYLTFNAGESSEIRGAKYS